MIDIEIGSNLLQLGSFILSWHGFFSFIAVASAVYLVGRWAPLKGIDPDVIYSIAIWAIIGGVIGARAVHVIDNWTVFYADNPGQIIAVWSGGIGIWGGVIGGFAGGAIAAKIMKQSVGVIADLTAPALIFAQSIGRLGDVVNGEHCANAWDHALAWVWTNPLSDARICANGIGDSVQPVIGYEIVWNFAALFIIWKLRNKLRPAGMLWAVYLVLYSIGRFGISFFREDRVWALGLTEAHFIALVMLAIAIPILIIWARPSREVAIVDGAPMPPSRGRGTRAERRRRRR